MGGGGEFANQLPTLPRVKPIANPVRHFVTPRPPAVISHSAEPVAIPGATSVNQVRINAEAGVSLLLDDELNRLKVL